jgi:two-component system, chemotaxis family, sensor histidine kinase and response regulator WspE
MSSSGFDDLSALSMRDLFRLELDSRLPELTQELLELESGAERMPRLEALMRGAHSLKGAARIADLDLAVQVSHAMEDGFVAAQQGAPVSRTMVDLMLSGLDLLKRIPECDNAGATSAQTANEEVTAFLDSLRALASSVSGEKVEPPRIEPEPTAEKAASNLVEPAIATSTMDPVEVPKAAPGNSSPSGDPGPGRSVRVSAENLTRLLALAGESLVTTRWIESYRARLLETKRMQSRLAQLLAAIHAGGDASDLLDVRQKIAAARGEAESCEAAVSHRLEELNDFDRRIVRLSDRLHREVLSCRMRPFREGVLGIQRLVREVMRMLNKEVTLEIRGEHTPIDRDILERLESALVHLVRNALDHGIETPAERQACGKPAAGKVTLSAEHSAGALHVSVSDDGRGISVEHIRRSVVRRGMVREEVAAQLSESELFEFMFLPGFTSKDTVTEISGRGYGLDAVHTLINEVGGKLNVTSSPGNGARFHLELPLTLSVLRTLIVDIGGEAYAFPLGRLLRTVKVPAEEIRVAQGCQYFTLFGEQIGIVSASQLLQLESGSNGETLSVVVLGNRMRRFGIVVDKFVSEETVLVKPLDPRLGKVKDISAAGLLPDGRPVLIFDVDDTLRSIEVLVSGGRLTRAACPVAGTIQKRAKRVLVVDDSFTVRELERKVLTACGYEVGIAVDGLDGWNALRTDEFDLVITDVDMPRMDGIELVKRIRQDLRLKVLPVIIMSFKERPEDRKRGLEAGADYYLVKSGFEEQVLRTAVADLIGEAVS